MDQPAAPGGRVRLRILLTVLAAGTLAVLIALPVGERRELSIEAWLAAVSALLVIAVIARLLRATPMRPLPAIGLVRRHREPEATPQRLPRNLLPIEGQLLSAGKNDRAFTNRLQPRLIRLADHYLTTSHGLPGGHRSDRTVEVLGDAAWLIDPSVTGRTPTLAEIERLLDRLVPNE